MLVTYLVPKSFTNSNQPGERFHDQEKGEGEEGGIRATRDLSSYEARKLLVPYKDQ